MRGPRQPVSPPAREKAGDSWLFPRHGKRSVMPSCSLVQGKSLRLGWLGHKARACVTGLWYTGPHCFLIRLRAIVDSLCLFCPSAPGLNHPEPWDESATRLDKQAGLSLVQGSSLGSHPVLDFRSTQARHLCTHAPLLRSHPPCSPRPPRARVEPPARAAKLPGLPSALGPEWRLKEGSVPGPMRTLLTILAAGSLVGEYPSPCGPHDPRSHLPAMHPARDTRFQFLLCWG